MTVLGVNVVVTFQESFEFSDEWIEAVYSSLEDNMAIVSVDLLAREEEGQLEFLLGIKRFLTDGNEFALGVAEDAINKALTGAVSAGGATESHVVTSNRIAEFA